MLIALESGNFLAVYMRISYTLESTECLVDGFGAHDFTFEEGLNFVSTTSNLDPVVDARH